MALTLAQQRLADVDLFLNEEEWAERVLFYPAGGGATRSLVVLVRHRREAEDAELVDRDVERIDVWCTKQPGHAKGGIASPTKTSLTADALQRDGDGDADRYVFTGACVDHGAYWQLTFERPRVRALGTERTR